MHDRPDIPGPGADAAAPPTRLLTLASIGVAIGFAVAAAAMISPWFKPGFLVLLGRTLFLSIVLLLVFAAAQRVPDRRLPRWLPRWVLVLLAVGLAAPLTTLLIYVASMGGDVVAFVGSGPHVWGFMITAGTALVLGLVVTLTAQLREREAQARSRELQFALERSRLEKQAIDARLSLLQAQIEPHFLFNTLANVQALVEAGSPRAADVLKSLIAYLRAAMPRLHDGPATLAQELTLVRAYLELMRMRMPDRLACSVDVDPALERLRFPPMALLTLVENAVRHGIDPAEDGGRIDVGARTEADGGLRLWVADTGVGMSAKAEPGTGLQNLRERLEAQYGKAARLELTELQPHGLRVEIVLPDLAAAR
jgi:signal transduction histidine kinase